MRLHVQIAAAIGFGHLGLDRQIDGSGLMRLARRERIDLDIIGVDKTGVAQMLTTLPAPAVVLSAETWPSPP